MLAIPQDKIQAEQFRDGALQCKGIGDPRLDDIGVKTTLVLTIPQKEFGTLATSNGLN